MATCDECGAWAEWLWWPDTAKLFCAEHGPDQVNYPDEVDYYTRIAPPYAESVEGRAVELLRKLRAVHERWLGDEMNTDETMSCISVRMADVLTPSSPPSTRHGSAKPCAT